MAVTETVAPTVADRPWLRMLRERISTSLWSERYWLIPAALLFAWLSFLAFVIPVDHDEAVYSVVARGILEGHWPYRDFFDNKPPLVYVWYLPVAAARAIEVQRIFGAALAALSVGAMAVIARRWFEPRYVARIAIVYALALGNPYTGAGTSIETFMLLPLIGSIAVPWAFAGGALFGVAVLTKPTALFFLPLLLLNWRAHWRRGVGGAAVVAAVVLLAFAPVMGDAWTANVTFNREFGRYGLSVYGTGQRLRQLFEIPPEAVIGTMPLWLAAIVGAFRLRSVQAWVWVVCAAAAVKANGFTTGFDFSHYYLLLAAPVAIFATVGIEVVGRRRLLLAAFSATAAISAALILVGIALAIHRRGEHDALLQAIARTDGELYVLGGRPQLYVDSGRQPRRRVFFNIALVVREDWGDETRLSLESCPPEVLVIDESGESHSHLFDVAWSDEMAPIYGRRQEFDDLSLLTEPLHPCR